MKNLQSLINHLEAALAEHIVAQRRLLERLEDQERTVLEDGPDGVEASTAALVTELESIPARTARREALVEQMAAVWGVPASALTILSISERFGPGANRLLDLRVELRDLTAKTMKLCRRVNSLVGLHRRVMRDVIDTLLTEEGPSPMKDTGTLLNAEA